MIYGELGIFSYCLRYEI